MSCFLSTRLSTIHSLLDPVVLQDVEVRRIRPTRRAGDALEGLSIAVENLGNDALQQAIGDAHVRAMEALRRARRRAQEASAQ